MTGAGTKQQHRMAWIVMGLMVAAEVCLLYFTPRPNFLLTYCLFFLLFVLYYFILQREKLFTLYMCIGLAVLMRLIALFNLPVLSDDYYRFIWDGKMIAMHYNPFQYTPQEWLLAHPGDEYLRYLYRNMNSMEYHSVYPPVLQFIFAFAVSLFPTNAYGAMLIMKIFIFASECITVGLLYLLLKRKNMSLRNMLWYILNPLIVIELTGNIHFDAIMVCFCVALLLFLDSKKYLAAGICWGLAISTKMIPLMLAPLFLWQLGVKRFAVLGSTAVAVVAILFIPFLNEHLVTDINASLKLFYHLFEFNASIFYLIRTIAFQHVDYDIIEQVAPKLGVISFFIILIISCWPGRKKSVEARSLWIFAVYFLFATMVHPWYLAIMIVLCVFTGTKFPIVFSCLIPLSYYPYSLKEYDEDMRMILLEYSLLFIFMFIEWRQIKKAGRSRIELDS